MTAPAPTSVRIPNYAAAKTFLRAALIDLDDATGLRRCAFHDRAREVDLDACRSLRRALAELDPKGPEDEATTLRARLAEVTAALESAGYELVGNEIRVLPEGVRR